MMSQEIINRMGVMRGTSTFLNDNGKINERRQDQRCGGGCHRRLVSRRFDVGMRVTSINLQWSRWSSQSYM